MPPSNHPKLPPPPQPTRIFFDPFNSSSTGHQTAPSRLSGSTSWRQSRSRKLTHQFCDVTGGGGAQHISDTVGAGSVNWQKDGRKENGDWEIGAPGLREQGWQDIRGLLGNTRKRRSDSAADDDRAQTSDGSSVPSKRKRFNNHIQNQTPVQVESAQKQRRKLPAAWTIETDDKPEIVAPPEPVTTNIQGETNTQTDTDDPQDIDNNVLPQIFRGLNIYLNGSTAPLISDHKLKQLFALHGGNSSISLGRRTVTHVILGNKCGGGLASSKIQKENVTVRGKGIKFVTVQWILDSIEKGIRQPESRYAAAEVKNKLGGSGQKSVAVIFRKDEV